MKVWFTADTHFGHGNIIKFCQRPFLTPEELETVRRDPRSRFRISDDSVRRHDEALLEAINSRVAEGDLLWILGDFCWGRLTEATAYRGRIRCRHVHLVWGNHDHRSIRPVFGEVLEQGMVTVDGQEIWLNHYPMRSWNKSFHGSWHLYGHVHGRLAKEDATNGSSLTKDAGVDACEYRPWSMDELREYMAPRVEKFRAMKTRFLDGAENGPA